MAITKSKVSFADALITGVVVKSLRGNHASIKTDKGTVTVRFPANVGVLIESDEIEFHPDWQVKEVPPLNSLQEQNIAAGNAQKKLDGQNASNPG